MTQRQLLLVAVTQATVTLVPMATAAERQRRSNKGGGQRHDGSVPQHRTSSLQLPPQQHQSHISAPVRSAPKHCLVCYLLSPAFAPRGRRGPNTTRCLILRKSCVDSKANVVTHGGRTCYALCTQAGVAGGLGSAVLKQWRLVAVVVALWPAAQVAGPQLQAAWQGGQNHSTVGIALMTVVPWPIASLAVYR